MPSSIKKMEPTKEDRDQAIVQTPYGKGIVIRNRKNDKKDDGSSSSSGNGTSVSIREIELVDWSLDINRHESNTLSSSFKTNSNPNMLYTPTDFPTVTANVGDVIMSQFGRGTVVDIRNDDRRTHVVQLSSWRLASRSKVLCYLSSSDCKVMRPYRIHDMSIFDKVEYANDLKKNAAAKFSLKHFNSALEIYARAVDTVRYVQHGKDSTNEIRADLVVVMVTCCNNASLCSLKKQDYERTEKFAENALVLIQALEHKGKTSKIRKVLHKDHVVDSQLFGTWKVKSLILIAKAQMERHELTKSINSLKRAHEVILFYKNNKDSMHKQLSAQEKDIRKMRIECSEKMKLVRKREKKQAKAMFKEYKDEPKDLEKQEKIEKIASHIPNHVSPRETQTASLNKVSITNQIVDVRKGELAPSMTKGEFSKDEKQFLVDDTVSGSLDDNGDDEEKGSFPPSFFVEHCEALFVVTGIVLGCLIINIIGHKKR